MSLIKKSLINSIKRLFFLVKIEGESAWPKLIPEKVYLATSMAKVRTGDFIVFINPRNENEILVKKAAKIYQNLYFVEGNIPWATSSQELGLVPKALVLGKIIK